MDDDLSTVAGVLSGYLKQCERLLHGEVHAKSLAHVTNVLSKLPQRLPFNLQHPNFNVDFGFLLGLGRIPLRHDLTVYEPARTFFITCPFLSLFYISFGYSSFF